MKRYLSLAIVALMVAALGVSAYASTTEADNWGNIFYDVPKANTTPVMDGVISAGEYSEITTAPGDWCIGCSDDDWDDEALALTTSAKVYMSWDENYIYYASEFVAPFGFYCPYEDDPGSIWNAGCIQMDYCNLADHDDASSNHWEDGVGKAENGNKVFIQYTTPEDYETLDDDTLAGLFEFTINGNNVVFEHRIPWSSFTTAAFAEGQQFGVCAVYSIGPDSYCHAQLAGGCSGGKDQSRTAVITLKPAPVIETEAPETEAPAPETEAPAAPAAAAPAETAAPAPVAETAAPVAEAAPVAAAPAAQTGDTAAIVVLAAVAAIGTAVVVAKKH